MCLAIPGLILSTRGEMLESRGIVQFGEVEREVTLTFTPEASVGDYVLVHVGCAIAVLEPDEARTTLALLREMEEAGP